MPRLRVQFHSLVKPFGLADRSRLKRFIESIFRKEGKALLSLRYIFCSDPYLLKINRKYLKHDFLTDIITFELSATKKTEAEIYISIDRVRENAKKFNTYFKEELHRVIFHGVLHLCGYSDKSDKLRKKMQEKENEYLERYFRK